MIARRTDFSLKRKSWGNTCQVDEAIETDRKSLPYTSPSSEVEEVLEGWVDENYQEIIDLTEYLDSSRVKRVD